MLSPAKKVDQLVDTVRFLRDENPAISGELGKVSNQLLLLTRTAPDSVYSPEVTENRPSYVRTARTTISAVRRPAASTSKRQTIILGTARSRCDHTATPAGVSSPNAIASAEAVVEPGDEFNIVTYAKRCPSPGVRARLNAPVASVPRPPAKRALLASRLNPSTTREYLKELVSFTLEVGSYTCTKIRSKYDTYASLHINTTV